MIKNENSSLNEYKTRGAYHANMQLPRNWLPRYLRRFHVVSKVLCQKLAQDAYLVDIGGGEGVMVKNLRDQGYKNVVGVDPYATPIIEKMLRGSIYTLPFENEQFDAALCLDVLEHIPLHMQLKAVEEMARILKPGGFAIISVPNMAHLRSRFRFLIAGKPWRNKINKHPGELSAHERIDLLRQVGFILADCVGLHLGLSYDPRPPSPAGKILSKIMFNPYVPTHLCLTVMLLIYKPSFPQDKGTVIKESRGILRKALTSYQPTSQDPTSA